MLNFFDHDPVFRAILEEIKKRIWEVLKTLKIDYNSLVDTPPEFDQKFLSDPTNYEIYSAFIRIKNVYEEPVAIAIYYALEKLGLKTINVCIHDLVGGEPAWNQGFSGRDIDYIIVIHGREITKLGWLEKFLDDYIGNVISQHYSVKIPYNIQIKHNLIEIHIISLDELDEYKQLLKSSLRCYNKDELDSAIEKIKLFSLRSNKAQTQRSNYRNKRDAIA